MRVVIGQREGVVIGARGKVAIGQKRRESVTARRLVVMDYWKQTIHYL